MSNAFTSVKQLVSIGRVNLVMFLEKSTKVFCRPNSQSLNKNFEKVTTELDTVCENIATHYDELFILIDDGTVVPGSSFTGCNSYKFIGEWMVLLWKELGIHSIVKGADNERTFSLKTSLT